MAPEVIGCFSAEDEYVEKVEVGLLREKESIPEPVLVTKLFLVVFRTVVADEENEDAEKFCAE